MHRVFFNFQGSAIFGVLAFLGAALALLLLGGVIVFLIATGRRRLARFAALAAAVLLGVYAALLLVHSARSRRQTAEIGEEKYFCEVDCHLAYSVTDVQREKSLGPRGHEAVAKGVFYVVTLRTRFDEDTISSRRGNGPLTPNGRRVAIVDERGRMYVSSPEGEAALAASRVESKPLTAPLCPGESYTTELVFALPSDIRAPRLLLTEESPVTRLLIGHENSFGHEKTSFRLEPRTSQGEMIPIGVRNAPHSTRMSAFAVPIFPVALSRTLTTTR